MMAMKLNCLKKILPQAKLHSFQNVEFTDICYNSRSVKPGCLFVAIPGSKTDGQNFIGEAVHRGCVAFIARKKIDLHPNIPQLIVKNPREALAIISNFFFQDPSSKLKIIGLTGTNGKTTTAYLIRSILEASGKKVGQLGTIAYHIGSREIPAPLTTPESYEISRFLSEMVGLGLNHVVMEASSHSLFQKRVSQINFNRAVFTNLGRDHFDFHKNFNEYRKAKSLLFKHLSPQAGAILNKDDPQSNYFASLTRAPIIWYSLKSNEEVTAYVNNSSLKGTHLTIRLPTGDFPVQTKLIGQPNIYNILAAAACAVSLNIEPHFIVQGIESLTTVRGRMELVHTDREFSVMIDFAHTPDALEKVLTGLRSLVSGRLIVLFGCGGDRDRGKRPLMGKITARYADLVILTSDNPRSEDPLKIIQDIKKGLPKKYRYYNYVDRYEAIEHALNTARQNDLVLIAGKGHETYQIFKDTVKPFDDRNVVEQIIKTLK